MRENEEFLLLVRQTALACRIGSVSLQVVHDEESRRLAFGGHFGLLSFLLFASFFSLGSLILLFLRSQSSEIGRKFLIISHVDCAFYLGFESFGTRKSGTKGVCAGERVRAASFTRLGRILTKVGSWEGAERIRCSDRLWCCWGRRDSEDGGGLVGLTWKTFGTPNCTSNARGEELGLGELGGLLRICYLLVWLLLGSGSGLLLSAKGGEVRLLFDKLLLRLSVILHLSCLFLYCFSKSLVFSTLDCP